MKYFYVVFSFVVSAFISINLTAQECEKLIWSDEFDGDALDLSQWSYDIGNGCPELCGWGNNEQQYYSDANENIFVENGILTITAKEDTLGGMLYSSGKITTKHKADFRYGRIEASIKLPETQGLWPAFWMLSTEEKYGDWPKSGEIDIMELLGHQPNKVLGTIHTGLPWTYVVEEFTLSDGTSFADDFHKFSLEWATDTVRWFVDDILYHEVTSDSLDPWLPFQEDFHLIFNLAVGGNLPGFPDATTMLPQSMEVDWVRVYSTPADLRIFGEQPVVGATNMTYNTFDIADAQYNWTVPSGSSIVSGQGTNQITINWGCETGDVSLELQTDCGSEILIFEVVEFAELAINGETTVLQNQTALSYSVAEINGGNFSWTVPADATIVSGDGTANIVVDWGCSPGDVVVEGTGSCGTLSDTISVDLQSFGIAGFAFVQENAVGQVYAINAIPNVSYTWSVPPGATIVSGQGTNEIVADFGLQGGEVSVDLANSCGIETYAIAVSINPASIYCDFDGTELDWGVFGGAFFEKIPNPFQEGINLSDHIGKTRKDPGAQNWAGIYADLGGELDFDAKPLMHMKVFSENTGIVKFKIEDLTTGAEPIELDLDLEFTNEWVDLIWDFTGQPVGTFDRIALFFDFGETDTSYWYFDDVIGWSSEVSLTENLSDSKMLVYPNPASDNIYVDLNELLPVNTSFDLQIIEPGGSVVYRKFENTLTGPFDLEIQNLPPGNYFIQVKAENIQYIKHFVKTE
jgi:beta-glucanase (GH16 family)